MSEQRPHKFTVSYNGKRVEFTRLTKEHGSKKKPGTITGYSFKCPRCYERHPERFGTNWIDTESGTRHGLEFDGAGAATLHGSILCMSTWKDEGPCGWHVLIEHGVARDA